MSALVEARALALEGRLEPTSLELHAGELVGLVGPNGSGKTSLLHALASIPPAQGDVRISGQSAHGLHPDTRQKLFTLLPASRDIIWPLKARDLIELGLPPGIDWTNIVEQLGLGPLLDRRMDQLSTGERSRVLLGRALAPDPQLLLLDEPIANLDPYWQLTTIEELQRLAVQCGKAVLLAIHDLRAATERCSRLLLMEGRRLIADTTPADLNGSGLIEKVFQVRIGEKGQLMLPPEDPRSLP